ncbi:MAG: 7,8-didemethyl-8-hydroxy-5-deazariboflavin synthase CofG [Actinomycetota bacterium]|nr:7,8-didemethyl-8-hydroxy-5-deazariboflavin synthase CofG [Actinomycetota bacterium]
MPFPAPDPDLALRFLTGASSSEALLSEARRLRDEGKGRTVTFSRKVFVPLTTLCRDRCTYCTFAKPPGAGGVYLTPDEVMAIVLAGERHGCTEALFTLGDRPENRWSAAQEFLSRNGHASTLAYVQHMTERVVSETSLFPHANPGLMDESAQRALRKSNPSLGLMLENSSPRLMEPGMPHHDCPDKDPAARMETIETAGRLSIPFTTGILVGIGETPTEIVESLFALADAHRRWGHLQEIIVQNFRPKADTRMRGVEPPTLEFFTSVVALTRWIFGAEMNVQVPPNLTDDFGVYLGAGINDWGGVSPLTIDWVNPEAPWPHLDRLRSVTEAAGFQIRPRLPVYPEYLEDRWIDPGLLPNLMNRANDEGYAVVEEKAAT